MSKRVCAQRASHRKSQAKYVAKNPKAQAKRVKASEKRTGKTVTTASTTKPKGNSGSRSKGAGQHGQTIGRPRKNC